MTYKKTAIIFGITGQDGAYLSHLLLQKGYKVIGTTRDRSSKNLHRLERLNITKKITLLTGVATNPKFCDKIFKSTLFCFNKSISLIETPLTLSNVKILFDVYGQ